MTDGMGRSPARGRTGSLMNDRGFEMRSMIFAALLSIAMVPTASATAQPRRQADREAVTQVLAQYRSAIERLDATGTERLFAPDSQMFESGGVEGTTPIILPTISAPSSANFEASASRT